MTAHGERDVSARMSVMSPAAGRVLEGLLPIMQHAGIRKLTVRIAAVGGLRKISGIAEYICDVPPSIREYGDAVKDSMAEIVASLGFLSVEIQATSEETSELSGFYSQLDAMYKSARYTDMCHITEATGAAEAESKSGDEAKADEAVPAEVVPEAEPAKKEKPKSKAKDK